MADTKVVSAPDAHNRFKDAPWYGQQSIVVLGQGGIGSWLSLLLARAGHELYTYDFDTVEEHNLGGQLFSYTSIGKKKTEAVGELLELLASNVPNKFGKFEAKSMVLPITMVGPDKMEPRRLAFEKWYSVFKHSFGKDMDGCSPVFIDGRLEAETMQVFTVDSEESAQRYMKDYLFPDADVPDAPCTFRATSHSAVKVASYMVDILNNHVTNFREGVAVREVPFMLSYEAPTITFDAK